MNIATINNIAIQKQRQILQRSKQLKLDIVQLLGILQKDNVWKVIRGILRNRPTGIQYQRNVRKEWL